MTNFQALLKNITYKYEQLKNANDPGKKIAISTQLINICTQAQKQLDLQIPSSKIFRHKTHITNIKIMANQIQQQNQIILQNNGKNKDDLLLSSSKINIDKYKINYIGQKQNQEQKELSKKICIYIAVKELSSKQIKISTKQLQDLQQEIQKNCQILQQAKSLLIQQGHDIQLALNKIDQAYDNTVKANKDIQDAAAFQFQARLAKIKVGFTGILAAIGYGILGLPGFILGSVVGLYKNFI